MKRIQNVYIFEILYSKFIVVGIFYYTINSYNFLENLKFIKRPKNEKKKRKAVGITVEKGSS